MVAQDSHTAIENKVTTFLGEEQLGTAWHSLAQLGISFDDLGQNWLRSEAFPSLRSDLQQLRRLHLKENSHFDYPGIFDE